VHAGLGAQRAERVRAADLDGGALQPRHLALGLFEQFRPEVLALGIAQVHALEHGAPVLRLGAAGAGLDLDEAVVGVERIAEHPLELEVGHLLAELADVGLDRHQRRVVFVGARHVEQFLRVGQTRGEPVQPADHVVEQLLLAAEVLRPLGVVPHAGVLQRAGDFGQPTLLGVDVKDTSAGRRAGCSGRRRWLPAR